MKIWIVVAIDHYASSRELFCSANDYAGLKVCKTEAERDAEVARIEELYAHSARVEEVTI